VTRTVADRNIRSATAFDWPRRYLDPAASGLCVACSGCGRFDRFGNRRVLQVPTGNGRSSICPEQGAPVHDALRLLLSIRVALFGQIAGSSAASLRLLELAKGI
jgi:hypothetical protein